MQDFTQGSITRNLLKTGSFMLVTMVFQTLYYLVDLYWVGQLGKEAIAAVGVAGNLMFVVLALTQMLGVGTTTLISHAVGRKDKEQALLVFNQSQVIAVITGALFLLTGLALTPFYAHNLAADATTAGLAIDYLLWFIPAMSLQFAMIATAAALRGTGNFKPGMIVQIVTVIINIILAPILMFGWGTGCPLGVTGAALATFIAMFIGVIALTVYAVRHETYLQFATRDWKPQVELWTRLLKIGLPAGVEFALMAVYLLLVYAVSRRFGAAAQAGFGVGMRVVQALFLPIVALGFAVAPVAGQNFGAQLPERVRDTFTAGAKIAAAFMLAMTIACQLAPAAMIGFFTSDAQVIVVGAEYLRIIAFNFIASGIIFVSSSMFQALGNTVPPMLSSFTRIILLAIPLVVLSLRSDFALVWVWYLSVASIWLQMTLNLVLLRREFARRLSLSVAQATG